MALFSTEEARAFDRGQLSDPEVYPDADIEAMEALINDLFYEICGVRFEPTTEADVLVDGSGSDTIWVPHHRLQSVTACTVYDSTGAVSETFDAADLADLAVYPVGRIVRRSGDWFLAGQRNVKLTYVHGWATTPPAIKRAALRLCIDELVPSDVSRRVTQMADGEMRYNFSVPGRGRTEWTGIPVVDTVLRTYNEKIAGMVG